MDAKIKVPRHPIHPLLVRSSVVTLLGLTALLAMTFSLPTHAQEATPTGTPQPQRKFDSTHVKLPEGYRIEPVVINLSVPTTAIFDGNDLLVAESGWAKTAPPR